MDVVGYSDRWSVEPGERLQFMVSSKAPSFEAGIVRLRHGDLKAGGPGMRSTPVETAVDGTYPGGEQPLQPGSYVLTEAGADQGDGLTVQAWLQPTHPGPAAQGIVTCWVEESRSGWGLFLGPDGDLLFRVGEAEARSSVRMRLGEWYFVAARFDPAVGRVALCQEALRRFPRDDSSGEVSVEVGTRGAPPAGPLVLGGHLVAAGRPVGGLNGKLDTPCVLRRAIDDGELDELRAGGSAATMDAVAAAWAPAEGIGGARVPDASGNGADGIAVNLPMRAVTGRNWSGDETRFTEAPEQYAAIHFHADDLEDAGWPSSFALEVPAELPSGVYAAHLRAGEAEDWVPFFVRPPRGTATAPAAVLIPTLSYLAYANEHAAADNPVAVTDFDLADYKSPADHYVEGVPLQSLYDHHPDGSGVCYASRLRPLANMRPGYHMPLLRSAHQFSADLHLVDWLEEVGRRYDVITDEDLDREGSALLERYRVVLTGSHPEYWTRAMLAGLDGYLDGGGRLMYLGGNGFYWVTSIDPERPHVIEIRRGRRGTGTWRSEPGEDYHSTTGELGGLWRDRGRPPQAIVGVGMAAQGFGPGQPFRLLRPAADDPRAAFILDGVEDGPIGDAGLVLGGASGVEVDRADADLGTPAHALRIATGDGLDHPYQRVVEEVPSSDSKQGGDVDPEVRADLVFFEGPAGGAVFSTGSIAWCGSLSQNDYDNSVSRITRNVLERFTVEGPF